MIWGDATVGGFNVIWGDKSPWSAGTAGVSQSLGILVNGER